MSENSAVIKIIAGHTKEMLELQTKYETLMEVHLETLKKLHNVTNKYNEAIKG